MVLYQHIILTMPQFTKTPKGGVVRGIEHHGVRPLCERSKK